MEIVIRCMSHIHRVPGEGFGLGNCLRKDCAGNCNRDDQHVGIIHWTIGFAYGLYANVSMKRNVAMLSNHQYLTLTQIFFFEINSFRAATGHYYKKTGPPGT